MLLFKACTKCLGDLEFAEDPFGSYWRCYQCGKDYLPETPDAPPPPYKNSYPRPGGVRDLAGVKPLVEEVRGFSKRRRTNGTGKRGHQIDRQVNF